MLRILTYISTLITIFCISVMGRLGFPLWIISLLYTLFLWAWKARFSIIRFSPGFLTLFYGLFARYAILPLSYYLFGGYSLYTELYIRDAIWLMVLEQIAIFSVLFLTERKPLKERKRTRSTRLVPNVLCVLVCIIGLIVSFSSTSIHVGYQTFLSGDLNNFYEMEEMVQTFRSQMLNLVWAASLFGLFICITLRQKKAFSDDHGRWHLYVVLLSIGGLALLTFVNQVGGHIARWQTIIFTFSAVFFFIKEFPGNKNLVFNFVGIPLVVLIVIATAVKNGGYMSTTGGSFIDAMRLTFGPESLDSYLNGPDGISSAIRLKESTFLGISSIVHDIIYSIPIVHKYCDYSLLTAKCYNTMLGKVGFIVPLSGQSAIYFGYLFAPLLSIVMILIVRFFDSKFNSEQHIFGFLYAFCACWFAMAPVFLNFTIINSWIINYILPLFILLLIIRFISGLSHVKIS